MVYWALSEQFSKGFSKFLGCHRIKFNKKWSRRMSFTHSSSDPVHQNAVHNPNQNGHAAHHTLVTTVYNGGKTG